MRELQSGFITIQLPITHTIYLVSRDYTIGPYLLVLQNDCPDNNDIHSMADAGISV